jgi:lysophospholipase L1-like esterase
MAQPRTLVCLGDSITRGKWSADWVDRLSREWGGRGYRFVNAGGDAELAWNALERLDDAIRAKPDLVTVLLGTNDVNATLSPAIARWYVGRAKLPRDPALDWYLETMERLVARLSAETGARIGLFSLTLLGEDLGHPANKRMEEYSAAIRALARRRGAAYLPLHERLREHLAANPPGEPRAPRPGMGPILQARFKHSVLRRSWDDISRENGYRLLTDGIHLNDTAAGIVADLVVDFMMGKFEAIPSGAPPEG